VPAARAAADPKADEDTVTLNFVNADIDAVVRAIGQFTGRTFVIDPRVKGSITLVTERPVTRRQAYEELLSALRLQGYTLVESPEAGGVARVLPEADAKLQGGRVYTPPAIAPHGDQVVTQVFRLQYESVTNLVPVLRPLIAPNNTITAYPANNTLVITDYAENLRRLARVIESIDSPATSEVEVVPMKFGLASDVAGIVNKVLDEGARAAGQAVDAGQRVVVLAEPRTNSLILRAASRARLEQARSLISHFDQPSLTPGNINVVYLRNAQAVKLAPLLRAVLSADASYVPQVGGGGLSPTTSMTGGQSSQLGLTQQQSQTQATQQVQPSSPQGASGGAGGERGGIAGMIQADPATNSLIISAPEPLYRNIRGIIDKLDVRPAQVMIESLVAEVSGDHAAEFGIQWQSLTGLNDTNGDSAHVIGGTNFGGAGQNILGAAQNLASVGGGLNIGVIRGQVNIPGVGLVTNIGLLARALESKANANILSRPNIQTLDNEEGKFLVGQNVPFVTGSYAATGTTQTSGTVNPFQTFERHDIGLQLRVKPQVSEGGTVRLAIYIEDSSVAPGSTANALVLNKRSFETSVIVEDGNFVVISGLIQDQSTETQNKVPILGDVPLIGSLFRYDSRDRTKTQTMVFLRPTIIREESTSSSLALDRYEYIRNEIANAAPPRNPVIPDLAIEPMPPAPAPRPPAQRAPEATSPPPPEALPVAPPPPPSPGSEVPVPQPQGSNDGPAGQAPAAAVALANPSPQPAQQAPPQAAPPAPAPAAAANRRPNYQLIQVAAVNDIGRARQLQLQLKDAGFDSYWESVRTGKGDIVRVRVSADRGAGSVAATLAALRKLGFDPILVNP
jgi:general secretion pathway protein D